jgi:hypothetical protein
VRLPDVRCRRTNWHSVHQHCLCFRWHKVICPVFLPVGQSRLLPAPGSATIDVAQLATDAVEFYGPLAEKKGVEGLADLGTGGCTPTTALAASAYTPRDSRVLHSG